MPQVIVNKAKWKEAIEGLELFRRLAKQVLSQLSYTPALVSILLIVKHLEPPGNCESTEFTLSCSLRGSLISKIGVAYGRLCHHKAVI